MSYCSCFLVFLRLFFFVTGNKMINEKIDRMLLGLDDFSECLIFFCKTCDFSFAIHIHLPFYAIQIDISYTFYVKKHCLKCQDNKDICGKHCYFINIKCQNNWFIRQNMWKKPEKQMDFIWMKRGVTLENYEFFTNRCYLHEECDKIAFG